MSVEIDVPEARMGAVMSDISGTRRGTVDRFDVVADDRGGSLGANTPFVVPVLVHVVPGVVPVPVVVPVVPVVVFVVVVVVVVVVVHVVPVSVVVPVVVVLLCFCCPCRCSIALHAYCLPCIHITTSILSPCCCTCQKQSCLLPWKRLSHSRSCWGSYVVHDCDSDALHFVALSCDRWIGLLDCLLINQSSLVCCNPCCNAIDTPHHCGH